jgi:hypothetical protein
MNNIAIVIGVSAYTNSKDNLPGCKNDAEAIHRILDKCKKFSDILYVNEQETSAQVKDLVTKFISKYKGKPVEELFFYYTGHGEFVNDQFYYILSDFDSKKRNQTSLQNNEMDDLMRTLNPNLVVKVIDACQSRTTYIKERNVLDKYFNKSTDQFKKCYFLNSSLNNQYSYQENGISYFTYSFIKALKEHKTEEIRYKDIMDIISDEFAAIPEQTPFFVVQADYTENFCSYSQELRDYLQSFNQLLFNSVSGNIVPMTLSEKVKQDAKNYTDRKGALESIEFLRDRFSLVKLSDELSDLYTMEISFLEGYGTVPYENVIVNWVRENGNEYFVDLVNDVDADEDGNPYETTSLWFDMEVSYKVVSIELLSKYTNIPNYKSQTVYLISKKYMRLFYYVTNYIEKNWESRKLNFKDLKWVTKEQRITDRSSLAQGVEKIIFAIETRIKTDLEEKFNKLSEVPEANKGEAQPGQI